MAISTQRVRAQLNGTWRDLITSRNPVRWIRQGEQVGDSVVHDSSANAVDGAYHGGVTLEQPGLGADADKAALYNGTTGYADLGDGADMNFSGPFGIEILFKLPAVPFDVSLVSMGDWVGTGGGWFLYIQQEGAAGDQQLTLYLARADATQIAFFASGVTVTDGLPHLAMITSDGTTNPNGLKMYLDRVLVAQTTATDWPPDATTFRCIMGAADSSIGVIQFIHATLDELVLYDF